MKKLYFTLLSAAIGLSVNAQTLTQANHAPANGNVFSTYQVDSTGVSPGAAGAGVSWNFSSVNTHSNISNNYTATTVNNAAYPSANIAIASSTNDLSYYNSTTGILNYWGGNIVVGTIPATITYTSAAVRAVYPMSLNSTQSAATGGSLVAGGTNGTFTGNSKVIMDGTGTLSIPGGTYTNALRVVTSQTINYTASPITGVVTQVNYDYYSTGTKAPLFTISTSSVTSNIGAPSQQTVVTRYKASPTGINSIDAGVNVVSVFPNPSSSFINFETSNQGAKTISIYDINGKLIESRSLSSSLKLDVSNYAIGIYSYKIMSADNNFIKSSKFTVAR